MPRCPTCEKMVSLEMGDIEVSDEEYAAGKLTASVRIVRTCADCSEEMKEATFEVDEEVEFCDTEDKKHEVTVEAELEPLEEGGGRYKKSFYGAVGQFKLTCSCGEEMVVEWSDKVAASGMEDLV